MAQKLEVLTRKLVRKLSQITLQTRPQYNKTWGHLFFTIKKFLFFTRYLLQTAIYTTIAIGIYILGVVLHHLYKNRNKRPRLVSIIEYGNFVVLSKCWKDPEQSFGGHKMSTHYWSEYNAEVHKRLSRSQMKFFLLFFLTTLNSKTS